MDKRICSLKSRFPEHTNSHSMYYFKVITPNQKIRHAGRKSITLQQQPRRFSYVVNNFQSLEFNSIAGQLAEVVTALSNQ
jgi:hypothetical protein